MWYCKWWSHHQTLGNSPPGVSRRSSPPADPSCWGRGWQRSSETRDRWWWSWTELYSPPYGSRAEKQVSREVALFKYTNWNCWTWMHSFNLPVPHCRTPLGPGRTRSAPRGTWWRWRSQSSESTSSSPTSGPQRPPSWLQDGAKRRGGKWRWRYGRISACLLMLS